MSDAVCNSRKNLLPAIMLAVTALTGVSCGGGDQLAGGGIGGTGITYGTVTGFGSIFVNGVEFDTTGATRYVDDMSSVSNGMDDATMLDQGMVVTVAGTINADGVTGVATSVRYDEVVEGPVSTVSAENADMTAKTFEVFDTTVIAGRYSTVYVNTDYLSLDVDRIAEVSGFFDAAGNLRATRIEDHGISVPGAVVQLKGTVSGFNGVDTFMLGSIAVSYDGTTVFSDLPGSVTDGQYVEVAGLLNPPATIRAVRIGLESSGLTGSGAVSLEGIVTDYISTADFRVSGQRVDASAAGFIPVQLATGIRNDQRIEVEGQLTAGILYATQVEQRSGDVILAGRVTSTNISAGTFLLEVVSGQSAIAVSIDSRTQLEDDRGGIKPFTLVDLNAGDEVIMEGYVEGSGAVIVSQLERRVLEKFELKGPVDFATGNALAGSISILGVTMQTDHLTEFEDANDNFFPNGGDDFFIRVLPGDLIRVDDEVPVDGIADAAEFEN
jgi:hypothetical protein